MLSRRQKELSHTFFLFFTTNLARGFSGFENYVVNYVGLWYNFAKTFGKNIW